MQLPAAYYGTAAQVKTRAVKMAKALDGGATWTAVLGHETVDLDIVPGLFVIAGDLRTAKSVPQIFCGLTLEMVRVALAERTYFDKPFEDALFTQLLDSIWGTLALLSQPNISLVGRDPEQRFQPLLQAALRFWPTLEGFGPRYAVATFEGTPLWSHPGAIKILLGTAGVTREQLLAPLPKGGPAALLANLSPRND